MNVFKKRKHVFFVSSYLPIHVVKENKTFVKITFFWVSLYDSLKLSQLEQNLPWTLDRLVKNNQLVYSKSEKYLW